MSKQKMSKEQKQFDDLIQKKVDSFPDAKTLILEVSRVTYYLTQLNSKLWQDINENHEVSKKNQPTSVKNSKQPEAV